MTTIAFLVTGLMGTGFVQRARAKRGEGRLDVAAAMRAPSA